jgi:uncharacterized protein
MKVAITGSSGLVGTALSERLEREDHEVLRMTRGSSDDAGAMWNPADGWIRPGLLEGTDAVIHLASANLGEKRWTEERKELLSRSRIDSTRLLADHIGGLSDRPSVLVSASAVGFYGSRGDEELTEQSSRGEGFLAEMVEAWEREALRAEEFGVRVVLTRSGVILSKDSGALKKMLLPFQLGVGGPIGRGTRWFSWISVPDVVSAMMLALQSDLSGPVNTCSTPVTNAEFTRAFGSALRRPTIFPIPPPMLRLMYGQMGEETVLVSQRAVPSRLRELGFDFQHPDIRSGLRVALGKAA